MSKCVAYSCEARYAETCYVMVPDGIEDHDEICMYVYGELDVINNQSPSKIEFLEYPDYPAGDYAEVLAVADDALVKVPALFVPQVVARYGDIFDAGDLIDTGFLPSARPMSFDASLTLSLFDFDELPECGGDGAGELEHMIENMEIMPKDWRGPYRIEIQDWEAYRRYYEARRVKPAAAN